MIEIFYKMVEISLQASVIVLAVLALRLIFRKAPKRFRCALWGLVALRLLLPFPVQSPVSLQPDTASVRENMETFFAAAGEAIPDTPTGEGEYTTAAVPAITKTEQPASAPSFFARVELPRLLASVWLMGVAGLLVYAAVSYLLLRRRAAASIPLGDNVYLSDAIPSPFLSGVLRPRIYLPCSLPEERRAHVLAHERAHIRRGDHILKPLAFLLVSVYWFDPLLWLAYVLFNRDLELACDERVIRDYSNAERAAYAETLLLCGQKKRGAALSPLAFGEVSVKTRVKQALSYKKPALWIVLAAVLAAAVAAVCLLTVPKTESTKAYPIGVEVIAIDTNQTNGLRTYRVLSDGSAEEIEGEAWGAYGGLFAEADCFTADTVSGKTKVTVVKKVLFDTAREEVPITEERAAIFDAAAEIAAGEISSMQIFEQQTGEQPRFVALQYTGGETDVFRFDPANKTLVKLCSIEGPQVVHEVHAAAVEYDLDAAIHNAFITEQETSGWRGEFGAEGHILLGTKETKAETVAYVLHEYVSFGFENDCFIELGGHAMAAKLTFRNTDGGYEIERIEYPEDGDRYAPSIKRLFPKTYQKRIFSHSEADSEALWQQCATQAEAYLQSIGRSAEIMRDVERTWLYDVIDPAVADKIVSEKPELTNYPNWIGTREQIEDGGRYVYTATLNGTDKKEILFYKTPYDYRETVLESFLVSAETGEIVERNAVRF